MDQALTLMFQHADKGLSAILLIFLMVRLLPQINKLCNMIGDMKESTDRLERQSDATQKDLIKLTAKLEAKKDAA